MFVTAETPSLGKIEKMHESGVVADEVSRAKAFRQTIARAEKYCDSFQWKMAAETYAGSFASIPNDDFATRGKGLEKISLCRYRAAMQSETSSSFAQEIDHAISTQKRASVCFEKLGAAGRAQLLRSLALEAYFAHWLAKSPAQKRELLDQSWNIARRSLRSSEASKHHLEYVQTYNRLSFGLALSLEYDGNLRSRVRLSEEAIQRGRKALRMIALVGAREELVEALVKVSIFLNSAAEDALDPSRQKENRHEALQLWERARRVHSETALREISHPLSGSYQLPDPNSNLKLCKEALVIVKPQRDNFAIGQLNDRLAKWTSYTARSIQNPAIGLKMRLEALGYAEEAAKRYEIVNFTSPIAGVLWVHSPYAEHFLHLSQYETDPTKRQLLLEKGFSCTRELLRLARESENPLIMAYAFYTTTKLEVLLAGSETNKRRKKKFLRMGLKHIIRAYHLVDQSIPNTSWNRGIMIRTVADVQSKLAELEESPLHRTQLLLDAGLKMEDGLKVTTSFVKALEGPDHPHNLDVIGQYYREYGDIFTRLAPLTKNQEYLRKALKEYSAAAEWYSRIPRYDRLAECYWKLAETYDRLQAYSLASENFILAARTYSSLGRRVPPLKEHFQSYGRYLLAWSKIQLARSFHERAQYGLAAKSYNSAARLHRSTRRWSFLAPYYSARAKFEWGENLSKQGYRKAAIQAFHQAAALFSESRTQLKRRLPLLDQPDEKTMATELFTAPRVEYCQARGTLEEAMEAESQEDYRTSLEKFSLTLEKLGEALNLSESEQDHRETAFLSTLCEGWRMSSKAEIENSTELLQEACNRFKMARDLSPNQNATKLALGHEAFCKASISSRSFVETQDPAFREDAANQLDLATNYYLEAGFKTASAHAMARKLLLEALAHLNMAIKEQTHDKRAGLHRMTGALLRESARAFTRAQQPRKADLARAFLKNTKFESKIASHLTKVLDASLGASTNVAFYSQAHGSEKPVGLARFERGDLEVRLVKMAKGSHPESTVELEIEITNTGKQPIRLVSLDDAVPNGAELIESSEKWIPRGRSLGGALRRIETLQTETVRIIFRPEVDGLLMIRPKVTFVDAAGSRLERAAEPRILVTSRITEFLARAFLGDYSSRRLAIPSCGWRTLMSIVEALRIPRSHVYGEPRYGRPFGRQLDSLIKSSLVEYRIFPGERGRGGKITKVRACLDNEHVRRYAEELTGKRLESLTPSPMFLVENAKGQLVQHSAQRLE
jgi:tetratricopeptide (TPR) repeat protein